jgi:ABC-type Fe3+/spermidine/putrescine transport system ATPase subunit
MLHQIGAPEDLYERPTTRFVAGFVGRANGLAGTLEPDGRVLLAGGVRWNGAPAPELEGTAPGAPVELVVRPESLAFRDPGTPDAMAGQVTERRYAGTATYYLVQLETEGEVEVQAGPSAAQPGDRVGVAPADSGPAPRVFLLENPGGPASVPDAAALTSRTPGRTPD